MKTLKTSPELMTVIINIQLMREKINANYDKHSDFKHLEKLTDDELYELQNSLIPEYNKTFNSNS
jgi:hypothetical protein